MTLYTKQVYAGMPYRYKIRKDRYWDKSGSGNIAEDTTVNITLAAYEGLDASFAVENGVPLVTITGGTLPDFETYAGIKGVLAPAGGYLVNGASNPEILPGVLADGLTDSGLAGDYHIFYKNGTVVLDIAESKAGYMWVGDVAVTAHEVYTETKTHFSLTGNVTFDGSEATFADGAYLLTDKGLPASEFFATNMRFVVRVETGSDTSAAQGILWDDSSNNHGCGIYQNKFRIWNGSGHSGGTVAADTAYWVMLTEIVNEGSKLYYLVDDGTYTLNTLPDASLWTQAASVSGMLFDASGKKIRIGNRYTTGTTTEYWRGMIDSADIKIETGGDAGWTVYWRAVDAA